MRYIIIGASSSIGREMFSFLQKKKIKVLGTYFKKKQSQLVKFDIRKDDIKKLFFEINNNDIVIIFSAITNPLEVLNKKKNSKKINIFGTKRLINALSKIGCKIVYISSVEVFDGKRGAYLESSKTKPLSLYGKHKNMIEKFLINKIKKNYLIIRLCWTICMKKKSRDIISLTYDTINKKNAKMSYDNYFNISHSEDVCNGIFKISKTNFNLVHLASKEKISRFDLALMIKKYSINGKEMFFEKIKFKDFKYHEKRARLNFLSSRINQKNLGIKYRSIKKTVLQKLKILDYEKHH
jgi:dTDP-4-dehydrorhamnose reductase